MRIKIDKGSLIVYISRVKYRISILIYILYRPIMVYKVRHKRVINISFIVDDLPTWKTESLFLRMLNHPRFNPVIAIPEAIERAGAHLEVLNYCQKEGYPYIILDSKKRIKTQTNADMVFYLKPYLSNYHKLHMYYHNLDVLFPYVNYFYHNVMENHFLQSPFLDIVWHYYYESKLIADEVKEMSSNKGKNIIVTGYPFIDYLLENKNEGINPWKDNKSRKHIIYAPHHTIADMHMQGLDYGTFLETGEAVLAMAEKYKEDVYFAFKPHPLLYKKLVQYWGEEKTDSYYQKWESLENAQFENGPYRELFSNSDAMIHDCGSFVMEYITMDKPVMYIVKDDHLTDNLNQVYKKAHAVHYRGYNADDIENFIKMVINGDDPMYEERHSFREKVLLPQNGKSASENIIDAILGIGDYSNC